VYRSAKKNRNMNASEHGFNPAFNMATIKQAVNEAIERGNLS
jgi:hypothetical protein